jgi:hypothetical protein
MSTPQYNLDLRGWQNCLEIPFQKLQTFGKVKQVDNQYITIISTPQYQASFSTNFAFVLTRTSSKVTFGINSISVNLPS